MTKHMLTEFAGYACLLGLGAFFGLVIGLALRWP